MKKVSDEVKNNPLLGWIIFGSSMGIVFLLGLFCYSIVERRYESHVARQITPLPKWETKNEIWGQYYPREYESFLKTKDTNFKSKYNGSATIDLLNKNPNLVVLWAGYAFSKDYNQARGHFYAIEDIKKTLRTDPSTPGTCWTCKSPDVPRLINKLSAKDFYKEKWINLGHEAVNPIGCLDCHDPETLNLSITRPALKEAFERRGKDITKTTHQEKRSLVCAQCHVEYYFKGDGKYLVFPWDKGFTAEEMEKYYDEIEHVDWVHKLSKAPMLKAQHPDYELYLTGIHAERGISCADCHLPYESQGGAKFTDHHIQSPLNNIAKSCAVCHRESEETLKKSVYSRQDKINQLLMIAEENLVKAHVEAKAAWDSGATENEMKKALKFIRHAQWRWDWVSASNGVGIHSPLEAARVLATSIQKSEEARKEIKMVLYNYGIKKDIIIPDISTKEKAQSYIGLDMQDIKTKKKSFLDNVSSEWRNVLEEHSR